MTCPFFIGVFLKTEPGQHRPEKRSIPLASGPRVAKGPARVRLCKLFGNAVRVRTSANCAAGRRFQESLQVQTMSKRKRKLTAEEKAQKKRYRREYMTVFVHGKQKRVKRPMTIDGMAVEEFIR